MDGPQFAIYKIESYAPFERIEDIPKLSFLHCIVVMSNEIKRQIL